jgi:hypothetical protein
MQTMNVEHNILYSSTTSDFKVTDPDKLQLNYSFAYIRNFLFQCITHCRSTKMLVSTATVNIITGACNSMAQHDDENARYYGASSSMKHCFNPSLVWHLCMYTISNLK